jgi:dTDP-4-dehydrorhamnose reductase
MERLVADHAAELIVNCAAYTAVDRAESEPTVADSVNRIGAANMANIAREHGIPLIHISTDYVFAGDGNTPITECDRPNPRNVYGRTKLEGDIAVQASGCDAAIVRTSWLYSEFGHNFVKTMLRLGASRVPVRVVDDQTGAPTCATDLARAVMSLVDNGIHGFELYNFCNAGHTTWYGFAREIFSRVGIVAHVEPVTTVEYPTAAVRPAYTVLDTTKIRAAGVTVVEWRKALEQCLAMIE